MTTYLKSQQRVIDALLNDPGKMSQREFRALITPRRAAKARRRRGAGKAPRKVH